MHGLTSSFILFFPPLLPPERRVRPKCMAQRYCLLGTHTRDRPVPPGWALGAQHSPLGGSREGGGFAHPVPPRVLDPCLPKPPSLGHAGRIWGASVGAE